MITRGPRYPLEEFARRGEEIYQQDVLPTVKPEDDGKFVAIDIESREFTIDTVDSAATQRLMDRNPDAQLWLMRIGHPATYRIGRHKLNVFGAFTSRRVYPGGLVCVNDDLKVVRSLLGLYRSAA